MKKKFGQLVENIASGLLMKSVLQLSVCKAIDKHIFSFILFICQAQFGVNAHLEQLVLLVENTTQVIDIGIIHLPGLRNCS